MRLTHLLALDEYRDRLDPAALADAGKAQGQASLIVDDIHFESMTRDCAVQFMERAKNEMKKTTYGGPDEYEFHKFLWESAKERIG